MWRFRSCCRRGDKGRPEQFDECPECHVTSDAGAEPPCGRGLNWLDQARHLEGRRNCAGVCRMGLVRRSRGVEVALGRSCGAMSWLSVGMESHFLVGFKLESMVVERMREAPPETFQPIDQKIFCR